MEDDLDFEAMAAKLTPEKRLLLARYLDAHDAHTKARIADEARRAAWAKLFGGLDKRAELRSALEAAQHDCQVAAEALNVRTLPLISAALTQLRAESEAETHDALQRAERELAEAEAAIDAVVSAKQPEAAQ